MPDSKGRREGGASSIVAEPGLRDRYRATRAWTERICAPLAVEDHVIQSMPEVSPPKWHLAHVTWFFESFLLEPFLDGYRAFDPEFAYLFNSYYETVGRMHPRPRRGLLSRPTVARVLEYRAHVDEAMERLLERDIDEVARRAELGVHHEQQHQELLLMDIKHILATNPSRPAYRELPVPAAGSAGAARWIAYEGGVVEIGHAGEGFAYDNEGPRHRALLEPFRLASRPVTNGEYLEFIESGGYARPEHWLSDGWTAVHERGWSAPLYWERRDGAWWHMTLGGMRPVDQHAPVCHVGYFEADAYASWAGKRLPTEAEWEHAAGGLAIEGNLAAAGLLQPAAAPESKDAPAQMFGDVWEWTRSPYAQYPGFRPLPGALGEYNGKFMYGQMVLRGGCCATPPNHVRHTYRNFFYPGDRWQYGGLRLAEDA